jgi:CheY-like chemotaxis protein
MNNMMATEVHSKAGVGRSQFRIVMIEDSEPDVFLVRQALEECGLNFELKVLDDGEQGVDFVEALDHDARVPRPDLFLMDLNLPKKRGCEVLQHLKQSSTCGQIPVVILTSSDSQSDRDQVARLHATGYFRKPARLDEFMKLGPYIQDLLTSERQSEPEGGSAAGH